MNSAPLVSIITLSYNHETYINECLDNLVHQKVDFPFEIIVHDDASTDKTASIIKYYEALYPNIIKPIYQTENQYSKKIGMCRTFVYPKVRGKYIAICEGDDYWCDLEKLKKQVFILEEHPEYSACVHRCKCFNCHKKKYTNSFPSFVKERDLSTEEIILGGGGLLGTNTFVARAEAILKDCNKPFWRLSPVGDYPMALSLASRGTIHYLPEEMSVYRIFTKGSWSSRTLTGPEAFKKRELHVSKMMESLKAFDKHTNYLYTDTIAEKIDLNWFNLYWDFGEWKKLRTTQHFKSRNLLGKIKALYHCLKIKITHLFTHNA